jgi:signal transduction histidine kinase
VPQRGKPIDFAETARVEHVLAAGRTILAAAAALTAYSDPAGSPHGFEAYAWPAGYIVFSIAVVFLRPPGRLSGWLPALIQAVDVAWIFVLGQIGGPRSPSFGLFTFALVTAAYRWGALAAILHGAAMALIAALAFAPAADFELADAATFFARSGYLVAMSVILGYLFENEKRLRGENALIARAVAKARGELGLTVSVTGVLGEIRAYYGAAAIVCCAEEVHTGILHLVEFTDGGTRTEPVRFVQLDPAERTKYLFPVDGQCWQSKRRGNGIHAASLLDARGELIAAHDIRYPEELEAGRPFQTMLASQFEVGRDLTGRIFILDPQMRTGQPRDLVFLQRLLRSAVSSVHSVYLWRRLKEIAGARERARVARDLHDGLIQSLIGLEMRLDALRQGASTGRAPTPSDIEPLQRLLREEIRQLRDLMTQLKEPAVAPSELVNLMSERVCDGSKAFAEPWQNYFAC